MSFEKGTFSLIKAIHHINIARQYFADVKIGCKYEMKTLFDNHILKCDYIFNNIYDKLDPDTREAYRREMSDSLGLESINDKIVRMEVVHRDQLENIIDQILKGKRVEVIFND